MAGLIGSLKMAEVAERTSSRCSSSNSRSSRSSIDGRGRMIPKDFDEEGLENLRNALEEGRPEWERLNKSAQKCKHSVSPKPKVG